MGVPFGFGVRMLYDSHLRYWRPGLPCALRVLNYTLPQQGFSELGFTFAPSASGSLADQQGFNDILIKPPCEVKEVSLRDIGLNAAKLMFGAKQFTISQTFVQRRMREMGYTDPIRVFRDPSVVGIAYPYFGPQSADQVGTPPQPVDQTRLFSIESITHEEVAGQTLAYTLLCNASENLVNVEGS
jgi:hypothetical protein